MRDSFIFYRSFYESIKELPEKNQLEILLAISEYSLNFIEPEFDGISKAIFTLIKPQIDANIRKFENGKKGAEYGKLGGRPKNQPINNKTKPLNNPKETPKKPQQNPNRTPNVNDNVNENVNVNVNDNEIKEDFFISFWNKFHLVTNKPKTDKESALKKWKQLNQNEKQKAFDMIEKYSKTCKDSTYLKKARTYLNDKSFNDEMKTDNSGTSFTYANHIEENKNEPKIKFYLHFLNKLKAREKHNSPYPAKFAALDKPFLYQDFYQMIDWDRLETFEIEEQARKVGIVGNSIKFQDKREFLTQFTFLTQKYLR